MDTYNSHVKVNYEPHFTHFWTLDPLMIDQNWRISLLQGLHHKVLSQPTIDSFGFTTFIKEVLLGITKIVAHHSFEELLRWGIKQRSCTQYLECKVLICRSKLLQQLWMKKDMFQKHSGRQKCKRIAQKRKLDINEDTKPSD